MTKYNLEDFKNWLEKDPNRKLLRLNWEGTWYRITTEKDLLSLTERKNHVGSSSVGPFKGETWEPYGRLADTWKIGVDIRVWEKIASLEGELLMEREEAAKALEKAQEWRERQLKERDDKINELEGSKGELIKLFSLLFPKKGYNFAEIYQEIKHLKSYDLNIQLPAKFEQLQDMASSLQKNLSQELRFVFDLYLQTIKEEKNSLREDRQLMVLEKILQTKLELNELKNLRKLQEEFQELEQQLTQLQTETFAQVEIPSYQRVN